MAKRMLLVLVAILMALIIPGGSASAGTATFSGTLDGADPSMPVVFIAPPNCIGQGATLVHYEAFPITVDVAGAYTFDLTSPGDFASLYLFAGSFNPAGALSTCVAGDNSSPISITFNLDPSVTYYVVPIDDTAAQAGGDFQLTVNGPGNITSLSGCGVSIPEGSVVGEAPQGAQAFFEPGKEVPGVILNPGTYWVLGQDETETYYKVILACQTLWVRKDTMQPSFLPPQNGTPLPTRVVS